MQFKPFTDKTYGYEGDKNIVVSRVEEVINAPSTHSVNEEKERVKPVKVTFIWQ
ncbi:hypothetical protein [Priestia megaterium]|uniref:hypothetical protein n=1 Tax=Priestia megaterium TaxID=1404 RepID=UPI001CDC535E|nr:hypothetical protein [Priestia megaterium]